MTHAQSRTMSVSPAIIRSLINSQAGTFQKAMLENIMNSIDALATQIDITLTRSGYVISDNGVGFQDIKEIENYFETFGFEHEGDALQGRRTYGAFGIGRGQQWKYASTVYRSRTFEMDVDVQARGLDYHLKQDLPDHPGTVITGTFYRPLTTEDVVNVAREITDHALYSSVPITINGNLVTRDPAQEKWTFVTDDAYVRLNTASAMKVYNLGMYVRQEWSYQLGTGGVIVSRKNLTLNMARNEVSSTDVTYKAIMRDVRAAAGQQRTKRVRLSDADLAALAQNLKNREYDDETLTAVEKAPLITDLNGRSTSVLRFAERLGNRTLMVTDQSSLHGNSYAHNQKIAYVLHPRTLERFGVDSVDDLTPILQAYVTHVTRNDRYSACRDNLAEVRTAADIKTLLPTFSESLLPKDQSEYTTVEKAVIRSLDSVGSHIADTVRKVTGGAPGGVGRVRFAVGQSDSATMWYGGPTDPTVYIEETELKAYVSDPNDLIRLAVECAFVYAGFKDRSENEDSSAEQRLEFVMHFNLLSAGFRMIKTYVNAMHNLGGTPGSAIVALLSRSEHFEDQNTAAGSDDLDDLLGND